MNNTIQQYIKSNLDKLNKVEEIPLLEYASWPKSHHQFDFQSLNALKAALAAQRPLLLRGEPGTGKSQLARAAAVALNRLFVYEVVNAHTESQDLLWRFDAVGRLAEAQTLQGHNCTPEQLKKTLDTKRYISPGPLWWSLSYESAEKVYRDSQYQLIQPEKPANWQAGQGSVLLIDEIDKANAELPNGLLEIMGNNAVSIPWLKTTIGGNNTVPPLVIITTNEERELPAAFVRRCLVLQVELPRAEGALIDCLVERAELHFSGKCSKNVRQTAAEQLIKDRQRAKEIGVTMPGQAEYLDMIRALSVLGTSETEQLDMLQAIHQFALCKYPTMLDYDDE
ncbi:MAG: hypothetical protein methR_P3687 [Methyloprofundus sp.]|nr:MAG: hypothetical protein methR_P3687 [Methyloprofundus sp.]